MSELINNSERRKELLKHMILQLHEGKQPELIRERLKDVLGKIPYGEVVEVEQELIAEGLPKEEVIKLCDVHSAAMQGVIDLSGAKEIPAGHPVDTFSKENDELEKVIKKLESRFKKVDDLKKDEIEDWMLEVKGFLNTLMDVEKHYQRKENLLFPYLEKYGITGPPTVMWGKHDEIREQLDACFEALNASGEITKDELKTTVDLVFKPAVAGVADMILKEENILFPMSMDKLMISEWYDISQQELEYGYCIYDPQDKWEPEGVEKEEPRDQDGQVQLPSGRFTLEELEAILNTLPVDMTFVDKNDKVKYFSQGEERVFARSRAILNRDVRMCHPPSSVNIVDRIVEDFKSGKEDRAPFWIQLHGKFIHIEYFALRNEKGEYLGTLEVSQNLTKKRELEGEQRLLSYDKGGENGEE